MSHENFALNLCKANGELQLEFGRLLLENAQRNGELLQRSAAQGLAEAKAIAQKDYDDAASASAMAQAAHSASP